jgi:hypothetical protein
MSAVCKAGAGPSGLAQLRAFKSAENKGERIPKEVYDTKSKTIGVVFRVIPGELEQIKR